LSALEIKELHGIIVENQRKCAFRNAAGQYFEEKTFKREVDPLLQIKDAYPRMIIARTHQPSYQYEGINIIDAADWFLQENDSTSDITRHTL
jgi:hypothetical protein